MFPVHGGWPRAECTITKLGWNHEPSALVPFPGRVFFALSFDEMESGSHEQTRKQ